MAWQSVALGFSHPASLPHVFETGHNLALNSAYSANVMWWPVLFSIGQLMVHFSEILCTLLHLECLKTQAVPVATAMSGLVCASYLHPKSCGCKVAGHFLVWNLFLWYHNSFAPAPCSLTFLWAEIYTQEMENMTFCLCLCVCVISLIWN